MKSTVKPNVEVKPIPREVTKVEVVNPITNWKTYRTTLFERIEEILNNSRNEFNSFQYSILGYQFLDTKLILHFRDCNQVYKFSYNETEQKLDETMFFTKDQTHEEYMVQIGLFQEIYERDVPEVK